MKKKKELNKKEKEPATPKSDITPANSNPLEVLQYIYKDIFHTNDTVQELKSQNQEIIKLLSQLLTHFKDIAALEDKLFKDIRSKDLRNP